jgi:hypothetical protein
MPRDFLTLSEMAQSVLGIECALCQRRASFDVEPLKAQYGGEVKMPELTRGAAIVREASPSPLQDATSGRHLRCSGERRRGASGARQGHCEGARQLPGG